MKAAIISLGSKSSEMVAEAMEEFFDQVDLLNLKKMEVTLGKDACISYGGKKLENYDCVYVKGSFRYANLLRSISSLLEGKVPYLPLSASSFTIAHNKLLTHLVLQQHNIPMPKTYISSSVKEAKEVLKKTNYPVVMKFPEGTQGKGVMFADSLSSASSMLDALGALNQPFIIQEYMETNGTDIRALVVGEKVVAAMKRTASKEEKRSNIHAGGTGEPITLERDAINLALDTAKALGADICGVDILQGPLGPVVIEANISPGLQGVSKISTINIPRKIAQLLSNKTKEALDNMNGNESKKVISELTTEQKNEANQEIITNLKLRGESIVLPPIITKITHFNDRKEYSIKAVKGRLEIEEFKI